MTAWVLVSAGVGPAECALAAARVAERLVAEASDMGLTARVLESEPGPEPGTAKSVLVAIEGEPPAGWLADWVGTVQWIAQSPYRPHHKRRNWFVGVQAVSPPDETVYPPGALRFETMRAGGPGGQHQNKTESAVRVTHLPTGLTAVARDGRSQRQNRQLALARLERALAERAEAAVAEARGDRWARHQALERGNPVRVYEGDRFGRRA